MKLRIATRNSPLALWQAEFVGQQLQQLQPHLEISLVPITSLGDQLLDSPLSKIGGKGLFVKELEKSLLVGESDIAVHSLKDLPVELPAGLTLAAILPRHNVADAFVSNTFESIEQLPENARVGTSSLRRQMQLLALRPDLRILPLRGNVNSRLAKLAAGGYDAIVLAAAGLERLGLQAVIKKIISFKEMLPAVAQGALGVECRAEEPAIQSLLQKLADAETTCCVTAERAVTAHLGGGCQMPLAALANWNAGCLRLEARLGQPTGQKILQAALLLPEANVNDLASANILGRAVAELLLVQGGEAILAELRL